MLDALDLIGRSGAAVFVIGGHGQIVFWNPACEKITGITASEALGNTCNRILGARDVYGNVYCALECPASHQTRVHKTEPVRPFPVVFTTPHGASVRLTLSTILLEAGRPELSAVAHVLGSEGEPPADIDQAAIAAALAQAARAPRETQAGRVVALTRLEQGLLRSLAQGATVGEAGAELHLAPECAADLERSIFNKLDVRPRIAALVFSFQNALL